MTAPRPTWHRTAALALVTVLAVAVCVWMAAPFLPALTWAVALAAIGLPVHRWIVRRVPNGNVAAALSTTVVVLVVATPIVLSAGQLARETKQVADKVKEHTTDRRWKEEADRLPVVGGLVQQIDPAEIERQVRAAGEYLVGRSVWMAGGLAAAAVQTLAAVFVLFFCFRDRHHLLERVKELIPLPAADAGKVIDRAADAIHATVYGTLLTAVLQGVTGGLLFAAVGVPGAVVWAVVMIILGILPFVGAVLVWVPACVYLGSQGMWWQVAAVATWGLLMAGPVCNWVYASAAGDRMRLHPVPALLAYVGGLAVFGAAGMVLGPCVLAVTVALLDIWRVKPPAVEAARAAVPERALVVTG